MNKNNQIVKLFQSPNLDKFSVKNLVSCITQHILMKIQRFMLKYKELDITQFLRLFRYLLQPIQQQEFYVMYGLVQLFQQICNSYQCDKYVRFQHISNLLMDHMPRVSENVIIQQKILPSGVSSELKGKVSSPEVYGKILQQRVRLSHQPYLHDRIQHLNRQVGQAEYSFINNQFIIMDKPSANILILNQKLNIVQSITTEQDISKRDTMITYFAWSEYEQRIACILGNYSISLWAREDNFRFQVNVPLPSAYLANPYVIIKYCQFAKVWYTLDNRPTIYILRSYNFQPQHIICHPKITKSIPTQKIYITELKYQQLICLAFEKNIFLISFQTQQIVSELHNFKTSITSIAFSQCYQALFISTFDNYFQSFELQSYCDFTLKGRFEGIKHTIVLLGVFQSKPVVYSLQQDSILKLWDIRDFNNYQTVSILKNIIYQQVLLIPEAICFIGSKLYIYRWQKINSYKIAQKIILVDLIQRNILIVSYKSVRIHHHLSGILIKVIKGVFEDQDIYFAHLIKRINQLYLANEEGLFHIYQTKNLTLVHTISMQSKPSYIHFEEQLSLLSISSMGNISIYHLKQTHNYVLKRKIFNHQRILQYVQINSEHQLIILRYQDDSQIYFYSYEKMKLVGMIQMNDFISVIFVPTFQLILVLLQDQLLVIEYNWNNMLINFNIKRSIDLWAQKQLLNHSVQLQNYNLDQLKSSAMAIFDKCVVISSTYSALFCVIKINFNMIDAPTLNQPSYQNPFRAITQNHNHNSFTHHSLISLSIVKKFNIVKEYHWKSRTSNAFNRLDKIDNSYFAISDQKNNLLFYSLQGNIVGMLNLDQMIPKSWLLRNYTEKELQKAKYVLQFLQNEKNKTKSSIFDLTSQNEISVRKNSVDIFESTMNISDIFKKQKNYNQIKSYRSCSLREKKLVLEKQRDEYEKMQNFLQHCKNEENSSKFHAIKNAEKNKNNILNFFNINRNQIVMTKGIKEIQLPAVKILQKKMMSSINKDEKKSIISKVSAMYSNFTPIKGITQNQEVENKIKSILNLVDDFKIEKKRTQGVSQDPKSLIKRLDNSLKKSKFQSKSKNKNKTRKQNRQSLPTLSKYKNNE